MIQKRFYFDVYVKAMSRELLEINMIQKKRLYILMFMSRICHGFVKGTSLNKYDTKKEIIFWCIYQGHGYVKRASLNKYDTKKGLYFFWICQGYVMAMSRWRNPLEK